MLEGTWNLVLLILLAIPGWLIFHKLRVPAADLIGPMVFIAFVGAFGITGPAPSQSVRAVLQIVVGLFIGQQITRDIGQKLRGMVVPALTVSLGWLTAGLTLGFALYRITSLDGVTAYLGSTPAGIAEMSLLAVSMDGDPAKVVLLQFFRVSITMMAVPIIGPHLFPGSAWHRETAVSADPEEMGYGEDAHHPDRLPSTKDARSKPANGQGHETALMLRTLAIGVVGGLILYTTGIMLGGLLGSMLAVGLARVRGYECREFPRWLIILARLGLGGMVGQSVSSDTFQSLAAMAIPVTILTLTVLATGFILALILRRITGWNMETCVLATSAAGVSQMSLIAEDLGADAVVVTVLHLARLMSIVIIMPALIAFII